MHSSMVPMCYAKKFLTQDHESMRSVLIFSHFRQNVPVPGATQTAPGDRNVSLPLLLVFEATGDHVTSLN